MNAHDMKASLFQPRWRRMKEKPPKAEGRVAARPSPRPAEEGPVWPSAGKPHRIDGERRTR